MLQHFHAGHGIELFRLLCGQGFSADFTVLHASGAGFKGMQLSHFE